MSEETRQVLVAHSSIIDHTISHHINQGLGPSMNQALSYIDTMKKWDKDPSPLTVYVQDDVIYEEGWLEKLSQKFLQLEKPLNLAFASGHHSVEHDDHRSKKNIGNGMHTNQYIRATCMLARHDYWMKMWPIPRIDPETGAERGRPHNGLGSSVDWWFIRNAFNSVCKMGKTNLIIPGLIQHIGYQESTWLKRDLPESESDKQAMQASLEKGI